MTLAVGRSANLMAEVVTDIGDLSMISRQSHFCALLFVVSIASFGSTGCGALPLLCSVFCWCQIIGYIDIGYLHWLGYHSNTNGMVR